MRKIDILSIVLDVLILILFTLFTFYPLNLFSSDVDTGLSQGKSFSSELQNQYQDVLIPNSFNQGNVPQYSQSAEDEWKNKGENWRENPENIENEAQTQFSSMPEGQFLRQSANERPRFNIPYSDPLIQNYKSIQQAIDSNYQNCQSEEQCLETTTERWEETESCDMALIYSEPTCYVETKVTINARKKRWLEIRIDGNDNHVAFTLYVDSNRDGLIDRVIDMPPNTCFYKFRSDGIFGDNQNRCFRLTSSGWQSISCPGGMTSITDNDPYEWRDDGIEGVLKNVAQSIWGLPQGASSPAGGVINSWDAATRCQSGSGEGDGLYWRWEVIVWEEQEQTIDGCGSYNNCELESSSCIESGYKSIPKPMGGEFVISGGTSSTQPINVDDDLTVYVNGSIQFQDWQTSKHEVNPISLALVHGDTLRIVARDTEGGHIELSPIYLRNKTTGELIQIHPGVQRQSCGSYCNKVFVDKTYTLNWETTQSVYRSCWKYERKYLCEEGYQEDERCEELRSDGCYQVGSECVEYTSGGKCAIYEQTYRCPKTGRTYCSKKKTVVTCNGEIRCQMGVDCFDPTYEQDTNFSLAAAHMGWLSDIQKCLNEDYEDPQVPPSNRPASPIDCADIDPMNIFKGKEMDCDKNLAGFIQDCCSNSGLFNPFCTQEDRELIQRRKAKTCHKVGTYCSKKILGKCVQKRTKYCCFNSKLARIIHEQGRPQLIAKGMWTPTQNNGWGPKDDPDCRGFRPEQLQAIDFSKIDFSEYYGDIRETVMPQSTAQSGTSEDKQRMEVENCPYNPDLYPDLCEN